MSKIEVTSHYSSNEYGKFRDLIARIDNLGLLASSGALTADQIFNLQMMVNTALYIEEMIKENGIIPDLNYAETVISKLEKERQ